MALAVRYEPISQDIKLLLAEVQDPKERSAALAAAAKTALAEAEVKNAQALGAAPDHDTFVDGQRGGRVENVRPDGVIVYIFDLIEPLFAYVADQLTKHSPVKSGQYQKSHVLLADGVEVLPNAAPPTASEYVFISTVPYARKIEGGLSQQAKSGVYEVVATLASRRFGNVARIRFGYRPATSGAIDKWARGTTMNTRGRRGAKRAEWLRSQPAIIINPR